MFSFRSTAGTQIGFMNGGSVTGSLSPGPVTLGDLLTAFPFDTSDTLFVLSLTGADLWASIENGFSVYPVSDGRLAQFKTN